MTHRTARLLHSLVFMGASLTGAGLSACGGISASPILDAGADAGDADPDAYPTIHADGYPHIGFRAGDSGLDTGLDTGADGFPIIYPHIAADTGGDGYPHIHPFDPDAYPTIGIDTGADGPYSTIGPPPAGDV